MSTYGSNNVLANSGSTKALASKALISLPDLAATNLLATLPPIPANTRAGPPVSAATLVPRIRPTDDTKTF